MLSSEDHHIETTPQNIDEDTSQEFKLPKITSLSIILLSNALMQISFFVVVSSSNEYAHHLGGTPTFSGVVIGIPTVFSGLTLIPLMKLDQGGYSRPLHLSCASNMLGVILYALAYKANYLYLILIGRIVSGIGFSMWMYCKRYVSDPRLVGIRRRTMLASWLITGNGVGMCLGPFLGGVLYRFVGFKDQGKSAGDLWNGFTSPAWILAGVWAVYWAAVGLWFEDIPKANIDVNVPLEVVQKQPEEATMNREFDVSYSTAAQPATTYATTVEARGSTSASGSNTITSEQGSYNNLLQDSFRITLPQFGVMFCMCWFAMTSFFILGGWESNIPIFSSRTPSLNFSPFASGNFLALGALACFPFFIANVFLARRIQDRYILIFGVGIGSLALLTFLILVTVAPKPSDIGEIAFVGGYAGAFMCWFAIALGFNLASTVTISLLSKQVPPTPEWNGRTSVAIQCSNYLGRVTGAVWGGSGVVVGMPGYVGLQIAVVGIGGVLSMFLWKNLKAKTG